jgi:hypothetical protein
MAPLCQLIAAVAGDRLHWFHAEPLEQLLLLQTARRIGDHLEWHVRAFRHIKQRMHAIGQVEHPQEGHVVRRRFLVSAK